MKDLNFFLDRKIIVDSLAVLFGVGSWIGINGMFVQLPLLVKSAPEAWSLPSYMSVAVQVANLGPITYALHRKFLPTKLNDNYWIFTMLLLGTVSPLLMSFFYDHVSFINNKPHSVVFLSLVFLTSIVGCTSSVLFFPFMRHFKEIYLISYLIGEGLSGFLPSILALAQGIGGNPECVMNGLNKNNPKFSDPRFSTQIFFIVLSLISFISFCSFLLLTKLKVCKNELVPISKVDETNNKYQLQSRNKGQTDIEYSETISNNSLSNGMTMSKLKSINLLVLMSMACAFGNGIFPSIQSYSCLPYGNTAYHLAVTLGSMANPVACFLAVFLPRTSSRAVSLLATVCALFISYALATSVLSPRPPLVGTVGGIVIVVRIF